MSKTQKCLLEAVAPAAAPVDYSTSTGNLFSVFTMDSSEVKAPNLGTMSDVEFDDHLKRIHKKDDKKKSIATEVHKDVRELRAARAPTVSAIQIPTVSAASEPSHTISPAPAPEPTLRDTATTIIQSM